MSDDPTNHVDPLAMPPTQPTLETILERINALGEKMDAKLTELRDGQEKIKTELWALRTVFSRSYGDLMIGQEMHERRISDLEKKVS
ncbi:MAG TPA: hypothetical protein VJ464_21080 [Blastocatellia bacterium]|nr:hypothetical protein [Blastocatellia bacterium]